MAFCLLTSITDESVTIIQRNIKKEIIITENTSDDRKRRMAKPAMPQILGHLDAGQSFLIQGNALDRQGEQTTLTFALKKETPRGLIFDRKMSRVKF